MSEIAARELRNDVSGVLRRVEAGEALTVTVSGRPVAELRPLTKRPRFMSWADFVRDRERWLADPALTQQLAEILPETTDDAKIR